MKRTRMSLNTGCRDQIPVDAAVGQSPHFSRVRVLSDPQRVLVARL